MNKIWQMTASEIASEVRAKKMSATEVASAHLERLEEVNPKINAIGTLVLATSLVLVTIAQISARLGKPGKEAA